MKKLIFYILFLLSNASQAQIKFGMRSGLGLYFDTFHLDILAPKDNTPTIEEKVSLFGNPTPRNSDTESGRINTDGGFQQEIFAKWREKNELSLSFTYIRQPRAYNDRAELFWGQNEDHREIYYQLVYSRKYWEKKKFSFQAGLGITVNKFYVSRAEYSAGVDNNGNVFITNLRYVTLGKDPNQFEWGFPLRAQFNYNISKNASLGLQSNVIYLFQIGINYVTLAPVLQLSF
jgi:hypothetical protein